jgi:hypothetical protein
MSHECTFLFEFCCSYLCCHCSLRSITQFFLSFYSTPSCSYVWGDIHIPHLRVLPPNHLTYGRRLVNSHVPSTFVYPTSLVFMSHMTIWSRSSSLVLNVASSLWVSGPNAGHSILFPAQSYCSSWFLTSSSSFSFGSSSSEYIDRLISYVILLILRSNM